MIKGINSPGQPLSCTIHCRKNAVSRGATPAVLAPGLSLPIPLSQPEIDCLSREFCAFTKGSCCNGSHSSGGLLRSVSPKKPGGAIPAMVKGCPLTIKVDPTTEGSELYCCCQAR